MDGNSLDPLLRICVLYHFCVVLVGVVNTEQGITSKDNFIICNVYISVEKVSGLVECQNKP